MEKTHYVRLPLKNAYNVRDLGGYACEGGVTKWNTFLRADNMNMLCREDIDFLKEYGLGTVIDLRSDGELAEKPNTLAKEPGIDYHHLSFMVGDVTDVTQLNITDGLKFLQMFYLELIKNETGMVTKILNTIAAAKEGAVLFHCSAGKDRTGITAMLLLAIAGVAPQDIVANYQITYTYNSRNPVMQAMEHSGDPGLVSSEADSMELVLRQILDTYGDFKSYFSAIGISADTINTIRNKFVQAV